MKKSLFFAVFIIALSFAGLAQNGKISYQAVVRNSANQLVYDQDLTVTVGIANSESGTAVYTETHAVHSNANGLISLLIGDGTPVSGSDWNAIQWNNAWVTAVISQGGTVLATHHLPLSAVPYALYADQVDPTALANYLTANHYLTEEVQVLSLSNDTVYLTGGSFVKLPAGFSGSYHDLVDTPTNVSAFVNDAGYLTSDSAVITNLNTNVSNLQTEVSNLQSDVTNLQTNVTNLQSADAALSSRITTDSSNLVNLANRVQNFNTHVCDSVKSCVTGWISDSTRMVIDSLGAYFDTTHMKTAIHDTAEALRSIMSAAANDAKITIQKNGVEVDHFTLNQSANQDINILVPTAVAEMTDAVNYVTVTKLGDTLSHYAESDTLKDYLTINGLCDSVKKCEVITTMQTNITNVTNNLDSTKTNIRNEINNKVTNLQSADAALSARITADSTRLVTTVKNLHSADSALSARITADSTNLAKNYYSKADIKDTLDNFLTINGLCDSVKKCEVITTMQTNITNVTNNLDSTKTNIRNEINSNVTNLQSADATLSARITADSTRLVTTVKNLNSADSALSARITADSTNLAKNYYSKADIKDTLDNFLTIDGLCDSVKKCAVVTNLQKADSLLGARIYTDSVKFTKADSALSARITADSSKLASNYYTRTQVDSADAAVRNDIGKGKLTITYANNDPVVFGANQDTNTTVNISAPVYGTLTLKKNNETGQTIGTFTANETKTISIPVPTNVADMTDADEYLKKTDLCNSIENCSNVALKNGNNAFTGNNTFSGKNTFTDTNTVEKRGFSFDTPGKTTESNCQVMVNACDLLAVFDSLMKRMDSISNVLAETQRELEEVKNTTMPSLELTSNKPLEIKADAGETVEITYTATLKRTDGAFTYSWYMNGTLQAGEENNTLVYSTNAAGTYKVLCVATSVSNPNIVLKDSLTTTICIKPSMNYAFVGDDQSADYGKIQITNSTATTATWKDGNDDVIGFWNSGLTDVLPSGEYTVVLASADCDSNLTIKIPALRLSSDPNIQSDTCIGEAIEIVYETTKQLTDATFTYKWFVNGEELTGKETNDSIHLTLNASGTYKVLCKATSTSAPTLVLKDCLTISVSVKPIMNYTIIGGDFADFGKIRIDSCTATSVEWYDEDNTLIGTWKEGLTDILPVGKYTVKLSSSSNCDSVFTITKIASPLCPVSAWNANYEEGVTINGQKFVTRVKDVDDNWYNVVYIGNLGYNYCWTRENMRATRYYNATTKNIEPITDGSNLETSVSLVDPYLFDPTGNGSEIGYLYNWPAASGKDNADGNIYASYSTRGVCPEGWHLPAKTDFLYTVNVQITNAENNAGMLAGGETWTECSNSTSHAPCNYNYKDRNITGFSAVQFGYWDESDLLDNSTWIESRYRNSGASFWTSQTDNNNIYSYYFGITNSQNEIMCGMYDKLPRTYGASVRCVRDPITLSLSSSEGSTVSNCSGDGTVSVTYTATIEGDNSDGYSYSWNGSSATSENTFTTSYSKKGKYTVTCTATKGGKTVNATYSISVGCVGVTLCEHGLKVTVSDTLGEPTSINWGDGQTTSDNIAIYSTSHYYNEAGTYNVVVFNNAGNKDTTQVTVSKPHTTCTVSNILANESGSGSVLDSVSDHQNNWYEVVQIGQQCWLKENMRATTSPKSGHSIVGSGTSPVLSYTSKIAYWYNDNAAFYAPKNYGLLYNWCAAMDTCKPGSLEVASTDAIDLTSDPWHFEFTGNHRGICPAGWHVPTNDEWNTMESTVNGSAIITVGNDWNRGSHAGKLSASCDWADTSSIGVYPQSPGYYEIDDRNSSGFSALPSGGWNRYGFFDAATPDKYGLQALFWTSSNGWNDPAVAYPDEAGVERILTWRVQSVRFYNYEKYYGMSVRCVRDEEGSTASTGTCPELSPVTVSNSSNGVTLSAGISGYRGEVKDIAFLVTTDAEWTSQADTLRPSITFPIQIASDTTITKEVNSLAANTVYHVRLYVKVHPDSCVEAAHVGDVVQTTLGISTSNENVCADTSVTLTAPGGYASYSWSNGKTTQSIKVPAYPAGQVTYTVTVTGGVEFSKTLTLLNPVTIYGDKDPNNANQLKFYVQAVPDAHYEWRKGTTVYNVDNNEIVMPNDTVGAPYCVVTVTKGNCIQKDSVRVKTVVNAIHNCGSALVEDHEGNVYNVVSFENTPDITNPNLAPDNNRTLTQCWTKENMRAVTSPSTGTYLIQHAERYSPRSYTGKVAAWLDNDSSRFAPLNYGVHYNWNAAFDVYNRSYEECSVASGPNLGMMWFPYVNCYPQGICPKGWHVALEKELTSVETSVLENETYSNLNSYYGHTYIRSLQNLGSKLVAGKWNHSSGCNIGDEQCSDRNKSDLSILPAFTPDDQLASGMRGYYWLSDHPYYNGNPQYASAVEFYYPQQGPFHKDNNRDLRMSVRCVKDYSDTVEPIKLLYVRYSSDSGPFYFGFVTNSPTHVARRGVIYCAGGSSEIPLEIANPTSEQSVVLQSTSPDNAFVIEDNDAEEDKNFEIQFNSTGYDVRCFLIDDEGNITYSGRY